MARPLPLLLFDLDGTLLRTSGAGARAMERAGKLVWGEQFSLAGVNFGGSLDPVILQQAASSFNLELDEHRHRHFRSTYSAELSLELAQAESAQALPGVFELLARLREAACATIGLLTGNYEETGRQKLAAAGLDAGWFSPRIWGDAAPTRPGLVERALRLQPGVLPEAVIVVGDTTRDVECAKVNGCRVLAVATGTNSRRELALAGADVVVDDLKDPTPLFSLIDGVRAP
ncbi:MAG TPA: HAD family hydrolase [Polyangiaceae bacterium]